jgi:glycosyltransferase involved in cell wall biosynthesis
MEEIKKVLIIYNNLFHYRLPIFNLLADKCELTVAFSLGYAITEDVKFEIREFPIYKFDRFVIHKDNINIICKDFDVIIVYGDIAWLKLIFLPFYRKRNYKIIFWTIGVSASYNKKFDSITKWDSLRDFFYNKADALIFYSDYPIKKYLERGFCREKLFVAPNTVSVFNSVRFEKSKKDSVLFIGTLYMQKGISSLLENYKLAYAINPDVIPLNIIGGGEDFKKVSNWIIDNELTDKISLLGPIYSIKDKSDYFKKAYACISPSQAGLSVLESMGYGVPFVTMHDAITGGERLNITSGNNGVLLQSLSELKNVLLDITFNSEVYIEMGKNALNHYREFRKPEDMVDGLVRAIDFVCRNE